ncbi:MAG: virulence factor SrfB, partial [Muribaculaceae bacterium]|nr:virulence factor SrfB [Muribaculaceae bacterium]
MDKYTANSLIANSGLHFKTTTLEINPEEPLLINGGKTLKYTFLETIDFLNDQRVRFDVCSTKDALYVPVNSVSNGQDVLRRSSGGMIETDVTGVPQIKEDTVMALIENYPAGSPCLVNVNSLSSLRVRQGTEMKTAFDLLVDKWLPMPMYEEEMNGQSTGYPNGWCRVRITPMGERQANGRRQFRLVWAFDTKLADDIMDGRLRPAFLGGSDSKKTYSLCNRVDMLLGGFLNIPDGQNDAPVGDYLVSLLGIDLRKDEPHKYKFLGYYIYLVNYLRLSGAAPRVTLYNNTEKRIPVDMSVDIGNSRTCAVLFENGDFTKARMLRMRDLSEPWRTYENAFDMRIVFRKADFGGDLTQGKSLFRWHSLVRVGEEARHLIYKSMENHGESERTTNYSSPKRYLWDDKKYSKRWELMVVNDDPTNLKVSPQIYIEGFTDHFNDDGTFTDEAQEIDLFNLGVSDDSCHYSRQSLMTFVMIEMLQQALCDSNSSKFRDMHANIDCQRYLRNIIVTC